VFLALEKDVTRRQTAYSRRVLGSAVERLVFLVNLPLGAAILLAGRSRLPAREIAAEAV
jgi:hypothetical protein